MIIKHLRFFTLVVCFFLCLGIAYSKYARKFVKQNNDKNTQP